MKIELDLEQFLDAVMKDKKSSPSEDSPMVGKYVIVRCRDAGVHAGILVSKSGRSCVLDQSRRLWYWKPANDASFLSGVAREGLHENSKVGAPITVELTENCEIILCSPKANSSISSFPSYKS